MADLPNLDLEEIAKVKAIASSDKDGPVLMLNLNRYVSEADYPDGELYQAYRATMAAIVEEVGGKILWRTSVHGHVVGDQIIHEALGIWYPTHQAFLDLATAPSSDENMRLRSLAVEEANLHRCDAY
jgi:uncharacterized protein (DUF1330 family)